MGRDISRETADRISGAQLLMYDQWGRSVYEETELFNRTVSDFFSD